MKHRLLSVILILSLSSCKISDPKRPLMGISETKTEESHSSSENKESFKSIEDGIEGDKINTSGIIISPKGIQEQLISRTAYTLSYNKDTRNPNWVSWILTANHTDGPYKRDGIKFAEDEEVPTPRATNMDYVQSGYDRGHMCPSGDNKWSEQAQIESFFYSNCCPQIHSLNAGAWNDLENTCRKWANYYGKLWIACGPIYLNKQHKKIGSNKVLVPEAFFKVVLTNDNGKYKAIGFIYRNEATKKPKSKFVNTIDQVERVTGYDFFPFLPDNIEAMVEAESDITTWQDKLI